MCDYNRSLKVIINKNELLSVLMECNKHIWLDICIIIADFTHAFNEPMFHYNRYDKRYKYEHNYNTYELNGHKIEDKVTANCYVCESMVSCKVFDGRDITVYYNNMCKIKSQYKFDSKYFDEMMLQIVWQKLMECVSYVTITTSIICEIMQYYSTKINLLRNVEYIECKISNKDFNIWMKMYKKIDCKFGQNLLDLINAKV
eukprot:117757_1